MSVLLLYLETSLARPLTSRLIAQGDEVRWIGPEKDAPTIKALGAFVARGELDDDDLIWRAAQAARTVVFTADRSPEELTAILKGAKAAEVERLICIAPEMSHVLRDRLAGSGLEYVLLLTGGGGWLARRKVTAEELSEAIDAADDHGGPLHEVLDLTEAQGWQRLGVTRPSHG